jgi:hypothetical protein
MTTSTPTAGTTAAADPATDTALRIVVPEYRLPGLDRQLQQMGRQAQRLGIPAPAIRERSEAHPILCDVWPGAAATWRSYRPDQDGPLHGDHPNDTVQRRWDLGHALTIDAPRIQAPGPWRLLAQVERLDGAPRHLVHALGYGQEPVYAERLQPFAVVPLGCDHCQQGRIRDKTFLVADPQDHIRQVGTRCVQEYTGIDPRVALFALQSEQALRLAGNEEEDPESSGRMRRGRSFLDLRDVALATAAELRASGGAFRNASHEHLSTVTGVRASLYSPKRPPVSDPVAIAQADHLLHQAQSHWSTQSSSFASNARTLLEAGYCRDRHLPVVVAALATACPRQDAARQEPSRHVGTPGEPLTTTWAIDKIHSHDTPYGESVLVIGHAEGSRDALLWQTTPQPARTLGAVAGARIPIKAMIKEHRDHERFGAQTYIVRPKATGPISYPDNPASPGLSANA